jgi:peptide/nickel transport system permease protein
MLAFAIRRLLEAAFVMVTVAALAFILFRFVGDPVNQMVGQDSWKIIAFRAPDDPVVVQFGRRGQRGALRIRHLF